MNTFKDSKKQKKFIIVLVMFVLFNFCYPKNVKAGLIDDITAAPAKIFWLIEKGVMVFLNNIFSARDADVSGEKDLNGVWTSNIRLQLTPDNIIKGRFLLLDANIFKKITKENAEYYYDLEVDASGNPTGAIAEGRIALRETISGWYYALRNFAIVALLSVLVYVGIRMIMTSVAKDKAKYKVMFKDWFVALCLLIVMHYLMIGILNITSLITEAIGGGENANLIGNLVRDITGALSDEGEKNDYTYENPDGDTIDLAAVYSKIIVLAGVIVYTFIFAVKYLKREFTIIFLILLGPVSCITYPIDKISDGKAQAFNKWFSEFLYQVIIQPFHLLLYIVLIGSAAQLANANVIYALVCFAILIPAEKFIKEMFGFKDKLGSPLGAMATGAMVGKALNSLTKKGGSGGGAPKEKEGTSDSSSSLPPKTVETPELDKGDGKKAIDKGADDEANASPNSPSNLDGDDPIKSAEKESLEEKLADGQLDESDLTDEQKELLGMGTAAATGAAIADENVEKDVNAQAALDQNYENSRNTQNTLDKLKAIHNQRMAKKWGSTSRKQRWFNRVKKSVGGTAKFATKAIGIGGGAAIGGALGIMTGKGLTGLATGAALGSGLANKTIRGASGVVRSVGSVARDYSGAFRSDEASEKKALKAFKADPKQMEKALASYRKNYGHEPSNKELNQEMEDRFALSRYGISDEIIDKSVKYYQNSKDEAIKLNPDATEEHKAYLREKALKETAFSAKLAKQYDSKDFRNKEAMQGAVTALTKDFMRQGVSNDAAESSAKKYLKQAASIRGVKNSIL